MLFWRPINLNFTVKAGTHWPKRWTSETFAESRTSLGTNLFGVFSCVGSFWNHTGGVWSQQSLRVSAVGGLDAIRLDANAYSDWLSRCLCVCVGGAMVNKPLFPSCNVLV